MTYYQRKLPHWHPAGKALFITWRLHGSLPAGAYRQPSRTRAGSGQARMPVPPTAGRRFVAGDRELDKAGFGPAWLKDRRIAKCVVEVLRFLEKNRGYYVLHAYVVMPNHVHLLVEPRVALAKITKTIKGFTARKANDILGRTGRRFWQDESFDHWVRNPAEFARIIRYIEQNPVRAVLVARAEGWPWSSASLCP